MNGNLNGNVNGGVQFLQKVAAEEPGDSDTESPLLDEPDLRGEDRDTSDRRMRAEAKSIRKVRDDFPSFFRLILVLKAFASCRLKILRLQTGL